MIPKEKRLEKDKFINDALLSTDKHNCIEWPYTLNKNNYPVYTKDSIRLYIHRYVLALKLGRDIRDGYKACHECDNPKCINPNHLSEGTSADNAADMKSKNRQARGEKHSHAKLTNVQVLEIKKLQLKGLRPYQVARIYNLPHEQVRRIFTGQRWGWLN